MVELPDPMHLMENPADKARAWERLVVARRRLSAP
jgi:hypothetical protein